MAIVGMPREAVVRSVDLSRGVMFVDLFLGRSEQTLPGQTSNVKVRIPFNWAGPGGELAGGCPAIGSIIRVEMMQGGEYTAISYASNIPGLAASNTPSGYGYARSFNSEFKAGRYVIQTANDNRLIADPNIGFKIGTPNNYVHADPFENILSTTFDNEYSFTEGSYSLSGIVKRDLRSIVARGDTLTSHKYQLDSVGLDTKSSTGKAFYRNPSFVEDKKVVYEFSKSFGFSNDISEQSIYKTGITSSAPTFVTRRESRADVLSLSLIEPNYLIEKIEGTVVDIYGNLVDLNRNIIPSGIVASLSLKDSKDSSEVFTALRSESRKTIAYHFEINTRKPNPPDLTNLSSFVNNSSDYIRQKSKFQFNIDKEGQFKLFVPMSSETGNIGLLTRYENYTTARAVKDNTDPRAFIRSSNNIDVLHDVFGQNVINIVGNSDDTKAFAVPVDRQTEKPIGLGTVFHDIFQTVQLHARENPIIRYPDSSINKIPPVTTIAQSQVIVSGEGANAGGRSGTVVLDGMLNFSLGANTSDRQSLWLDTAGGIVSNVGRDSSGRALVSRFDGDVLVQIGGAGVSTDSRFQTVKDLEVRDGVLDLRVVVNAQMHVIRIDSSGISVYSAGALDIVSEGDLRLKSNNGRVLIDGKEIYMYANNLGTSRLVRRIPNNSI
jgi:hypothetical protein